jgi:L-seryl-tRNA(Ser) seleniumtransferase
VTKSESGNSALRDLPAVHVLLDSLGDRLPGTPPALARTACREVIDSIREEVLAGGKMPSLEDTVDRVAERIGLLSTSSMGDVINATGIVLHTAIGRACLPEPAVEAVTRVARGYSILQWDSETGRRGHRDDHVEGFLTGLTGAEAATVVNNNAGATLLVLSALAADREVIVSRGQLVEIGGAFRIPDVMKQSRARMVEVGCTNRTHLRDYRNALSEDTAAILRVHPSNYRIRGFSSEVPIEDLVELGREAEVPVIDDLGAGSLVRLEDLGLEHEPTIQESIEAGVAVTTSSGDKLIGGPQVGIITGSAEIIAKIRKHPLARALRVGKLTLAALEATLRLFLEDLEYLKQNHPVYIMLSADAGSLEKLAGEFAGGLSLPGKCKAEAVAMSSFVGSGALPDSAIPSFGIGLSCPDPELLARELRLSTPSVASRVEDEMVKLDLRTVLASELETLSRLVGEAAGRLWA